MGSTPAKVVKLILKDYVDVFKARSDKIWLHQAVKFVSCIGFGRVGSVTVSRWVGLDRVTQKWPRGQLCDRPNSVVEPVPRFSHQPRCHHRRTIPQGIIFSSVINRHISLICSVVVFVRRTIDVKTFFTFFILVTFFYILNVFFNFPNIFFKNVGKVQSGKQINKKHFQNNSNEIDL